MRAPVVVGLSTALLLPLIAGCRAQAGIGVGLGVDVQIPALVHAGLLGGVFLEFGPNYGREGESVSTYVTVAPPFHFTAQVNVGETRDLEHLCFGLLPVLSLFSDDQDPEAVWPLELGLALGVIELRLGVNVAAVRRGFTRRPPPPSDRSPPSGPAPRPLPPPPVEPQAPSPPPPSAGGRALLAPVTLLEEPCTGVPVRYDVTASPGATRLLLRPGPGAALDVEVRTGGESSAFGFRGLTTSLTRTLDVGSGAVVLIVRGAAGTTFDLELSREP